MSFGDLALILYSVTLFGLGFLCGRFDEHTNTIGSCPKPEWHAEGLDTSNKGSV